MALLQDAQERAARGRRAVTKARGPRRGHLRLKQAHPARTATAAAPRAAPLAMAAPPMRLRLEFGGSLVPSDVRRCMYAAPAQGGSVGELLDAIRADPTFGLGPEAALQLRCDPRPCPPPAPCPC